MAYKDLKIQLTEPIYQMQEKETPTQFYFANEFFKFKGELADYFRYWYEQDENGKWNPKPILNKSPSGDEIRFKIPAKGTMENWSKHKQWITRKKAFWKNTLESAQEEIQQDIIEFFKKDSKKIIQSANNDWDIDDALDSDYMTKPHLRAKGKNDLAAAHEKKVDTLLVQGGMPKDIGKSDINVKSDVTVTDTSNELFVDELSDYNLDDAYDEVTEDVDN